MRKKMIPVIIAIVLIIVVIVIGLGGPLLEKYSYSDVRADLASYFGIREESEVAIILQDSIIEEKAKLLEGTYYIDLNTVHKYFNERFYEDKSENLLLYTLPDDIITARIGTDTVDNREGSQKREYVVARYEEDKLYIAIDFVKEYTNFSYQPFVEPGRMQIYTQWNDNQTAKVDKDTAVRLKGGIKSEILTDVKAGDKLIVLEQMETWAKVKTSNGYIGYVENKRLSEIITEIPIPVTDYEEPVYKSQTRDHKISLGWHAIAGISGNDTLYEVTRNTKGLNVISPTWFMLNDNEGNFTSFASAQYVTAAHDMGLEVWALVENITYKDELDMSQLLSATSKRAILIENLITEALNYELDGINVDFEEIPADCGEHFIQFIRELSIPCREHGLVLSVDNYVPYNYNDYYNRREQGIVADYVIIMGYDEHYAGGGKAGSVASIDYVENGIVNTLEQVPAEKVINAVPFYTRIWETEGASVNSQAVGMEMADEWIANHHLEPLWDEETCQNYCEYTADGIRYQSWLEDTESLTVKFNIMKTHQIGGVAFWRLGFEKTEIWDAVEDYLN